MRARAEFTVEPFVDGAPGEHVRAAIEAMRGLGLAPELGPFATVVTGDAATITDAIGVMLAAARDAGADRISVQIDFER